MTVTRSLGAATFFGAFAIVALMLGSGVGASTHAPTVAYRYSLAAPAPMVASPSPAATAAVPVASEPARASGAPATSSCPTPQGNPVWNGPAFFNDVRVTFTVPGHPELSNQNFGTVPCNNLMPTYLNGFYMNITTNVHIQDALLRIWATTWPTASNPQPFLIGFQPDNPYRVTMPYTDGTGHTVSFYFNDYHYFWPGTQVYFNVTLQTDDPSVSPSTIYSAYGPYSESDVFSGGAQDNATWKYSLQSPWASTNFTNDVLVRTTPSVLTDPSYDPNVLQSLQVAIQAFNLSGGAVGTIPKAFLTFYLHGNLSGEGRIDFSPDNHSLQSLKNPIGPYPGTTVFFNVTCYLPWFGGTAALDPIYSPEYSFNWSKNGGWWYPHLGVEGNLNFTTVPNLLGNNTTMGHLPIDTPVNVSIHEATENVTIRSANLVFSYSDSAGYANGSVSMIAASPNTSYVIIPGLPPGGHMVFDVVAKDIFGNPISSANVSYEESGPLSSPPPDGYSTFFFEAVDLCTGALVPKLNYTLANTSWSVTTNGFPYGFAQPVPLSGAGYLPLAIGDYALSIHALGWSPSTTFTLSNSTPFIIVFYLASCQVPQTSSVPAPAALPAAVIGIAAGAVAYWPISRWHKERQARAAEEQRRITL